MAVFGAVEVQIKRHRTSYAGVIRGPMYSVYYSVVYMTVLRRTPKYTGEDFHKKIIITNNTEVTRFFLVQ